MCGPHTNKKEIMVADNGCINRVAIKIIHPLDLQDILML